MEFKFINIKSKYLVFSLLISACTTVIGQENELSREQIQSVQKVINTFKTKNKTKISDLLYYPLRRVYPLKDIKDKDDFIQRFDEIFDKEFMDDITRSKIKDWSETGWRGIMFDEGAIWIQEDGQITSIGHQSPLEKQLYYYALQNDKMQLPKNLQDFKNPLYLIFTENYKIRIDEKGEDTYRYTAWKIKNQKNEPNLVIENGVFEPQGSGGNHTITFRNNGYIYIVSINVIGSDDDSESTLEVRQQEKTLLKESGKIIRN